MKLEVLGFGKDFTGEYNLYLKEPIKTTCKLSGEEIEGRTLTYTREGYHEEIYLRDINNIQEPTIIEYTSLSKEEVKEIYSEFYRQMAIANYRITSSRVKSDYLLDIKKVGDEEFYFTCDFEGYVYVPDRENPYQKRRFTRILVSGIGGRVDLVVESGVRYKIEITKMSLDNEEDKKIKTQILTDMIRAIKKYRMEESLAE